MIQYHNEEKAYLKISFTCRCGLAIGNTGTFPGGLFFLFFFAFPMCQNNNFQLWHSLRNHKCLVLTGSAALHVCTLPASNGFEQSRCAGLVEGEETARRNSEM